MDDLLTLWNQVEAAADFLILPRGKYRCRIRNGQLGKSRRGTPGFKLTFEVIEGQYIGRLLWHDLWLTPAAMPMTKRDLLKIGITSLTQLEEALPQLICEVTVVLRCDDDGIESNRVRNFIVIGSDDTNAFEPQETIT